MLKKSWNHFDSISNDLKEKFESLSQVQTQSDVNLKLAIAHKDKLIDYDRTRFVICN